MKISEVRVNEKANIEGRVLEVFDEKVIVKKSGEQTSVKEFLIDDGNASILLALWGDDISTANLGVDDEVIVDGYVTEYKGVKKISKGKYGRITKK